MIISVVVLLILISFLFTIFIFQGLIDRKEAVRKRMLTAAVNIVDIHGNFTKKNDFIFILKIFDFTKNINYLKGKTTAGDLLPVFEEFLDNAPKERKYDDARQSVVILMGSLAKHLDPNDPKVRPIMRQLILALNTPLVNVVVLPMD